MIGHRFGRLTVIEYPIDPRGTKHPRCRCQCDCGQIVLVKLDNLTRTRSCGCLKREMLQAKATHGMSSSREYRVWCDLRDRCSRPSRKDFARYGGRGIRVCERWLTSFENFLADMGPRPSPTHQIDRIDNERGYEPDNCRWATPKQQRINQRRMKLYTFNGLTGTLKDHARAHGLSYSAVHQRMTTMGWTLERALTTPVQIRHSPTKS